MTTKSYAPQVIADSSGKFCGNALRFATPEEAQRSADALMQRWLLVRETRVVETDDPVNYQNIDGRDVRLKVETFKCATGAGWGVLVGGNVDCDLAYSKTEAEAAALARERYHGVLTTADASHYSNGEQGGGA